MANQKLTQEEIAQFGQFSTAEQRLITELGQITLAEINLEERREAAEGFRKEILEGRQKLIDELREKYGDGSIDLATGEFIPAPAEEAVEAPEDVEPAKGLTPAE